MAKSLLKDYELDWEWKVEINNTKRAMGRINWNKHSLQLSSFFWKHLSEWGARDVVLHELAHILVGPGEGHGMRWKHTALKLGAHPTAKAGREIYKPGGYEALNKQYKYTVSCKSCDMIQGVSKIGHRVSSHLKRTGNSPYRCSRCGSKTDFVQNY